MIEVTQGLSLILEGYLILQYPDEAPFTNIFLNFD